MCTCHPVYTKRCVCRNCNRVYYIEEKGWWRNHFYCSPNCCYARRRQLEELERLKEME